MTLWRDIVLAPYRTIQQYEQHIGIKIGGCATNFYLEPCIYFKVGKPPTNKLEDMFKEVQSKWFTIKVRCSRLRALHCDLKPIKEAIHTPE